MTDLQRALVVIVIYAAFCGVIFYRHYRKRKSEAAASGSSTSGALLVAFASQTGFAEQLAWQTAESLRAAGMDVCVTPLSKLDEAALQACRKALFIVSTTGEGDAPDNTVGFTRKVMTQAMRLDSLEYGVLALGDRSYPQYCAFGHAIDKWLTHRGATPLFDIVEVDNGDEGALRHWQHQLSVLSGGQELPDWAPASYQPWKLVERLLLNEGSPGAPAFHLAFEAPDGNTVWRAGDIAEIGPSNPPCVVNEFIQELGLQRTDALVALLSRSILPHDEAGREALRGAPLSVMESKLNPLPHREYSIASAPEDGRLELLVRQTRHLDGRLGLGSGWLTEYAPLNSAVSLRIRENRSFHSPEDDRPLILIGNGTGMAGLRAHLKARAAAGRGRNWLLFGERTREFDRFYCEDIDSWHASRVLERVDFAFSRDPVEPAYVQDRLESAAAELTHWVNEGAAVYVCGSLQGMAAGVTAVLTEVLGRETLEQMAEEGRYRRDVY